jgi:hypothetical protein
MRRFRYASTAVVCQTSVATMRARSPLLRSLPLVSSSLLALLGPKNLWVYHFTLPPPRTLHIFHTTYTHIHACTHAPHHRRWVLEDGVDEEKWDSGGGDGGGGLIGRRFIPTQAVDMDCFATYRP